MQLFSIASMDRQPLKLTLFTRPGCHLCDLMKAQLKEASVQVSFVIEEQDISQDQQLEEQYGLSIPVLVYEGRAWFKGRMTKDQFLEKFRRVMAG